MTTESRRKLILVALNEINFDIARAYFQPLGLRALQALIDGHGIRTHAEDDYDHLEPWIQWPSVHTGLSAKQHGVFRLGDIVDSSVPQFFEILEARGLRVGCISPMNAANRMQAPAYFVPDPWTQTPSDKSWWSRHLAAAISQAVNDNAQSRITLHSATVLALALMRFAQPRHYQLYWKLAFNSRGAPWRKALFLDLFLHDVHCRMFRNRRADFSTVFFNAGAHIQHHYFLCSPFLKALAVANPSWYVPADQDPIAEMLQVYDRIVADYLDIPGAEVIIATGLSQRPYDRAKYYYRLRNHEAFLTKLNVRFTRVVPRMTRDFLVECETEGDSRAAADRLAQCRAADNGEALFGDIENRGRSVFAALTYPHQIDESTLYSAGERSAQPLLPHVAFVALKNGMHQTVGSAFMTPGLRSYAPLDGEHVSSLYSTVLQFFLDREAAN